MPSYDSTTLASERGAPPTSEWAVTLSALQNAQVSARRNSMAFTHDEHSAAMESRKRSMSVSFSWRSHPKSTTISGFDAQRAQRIGFQRIDDTGHGYFERLNTYGAAATGFQEDGTGLHQDHKLRGIIRRASLSVRSGVRELMSHRRLSVQTGPSCLIIDDGRVSEHDSAREDLFAASTSSLGHTQTRPRTSHPSFRNRLRQAASFHRHSRNLHTSHAARSLDCFSEPLELPALPVPGSGEQPPIIPRNTGAAARQAAASASHEPYGGLGVSGGPVPWPKPNWVIASEPRLDGLEDHESGIGIALTSSETDMYAQDDGADDSDVDVDMEQTARPKGAVAAGGHILKVDFITHLPVELAIQVLAQLDAGALAMAGRVSRQWHEVVANQHIWREAFLREKTTTYATGGRVEPGSGLGVPPVRPTNDWKETYRVKKELDQRWKLGKARPAYLHGHTDSIYCLQFDENKIITGSRDKTIRIWDMKTMACKLVIGPPEVINNPTSVLLNPEGNPMHYATLPATHAPMSPREGPTRAHFSMPFLVTFPTHHKASILCLQYDDRILVTGSSDSTCIVHSVKSAFSPVRRLEHHNAAVLDLVFDERHIVTCSKDVSICVWDRETGALLKQLRGHSGPVNAVQMRGNTIVSCSGDFRVKLWNIDSGKVVREFAGHTKGLACSQFSEDGRYIASAGNDKVIRIWDANTGECLREMRAHENLVRSLHVDSVSGRLVSGSYDTDIKVWNMATGLPVLEFPRWHHSWVLSAKSDYRRIVSTGQDPKILIMDFGAGVRGIELLEDSLPPVSKPADGFHGNYI